MRKSIHAVTRRLLAVLLFSAVLMSCSGPRYLNTGDVRTEQSVKLYLQNGDAYEGIVVGQEGSELSLLNQSDKQTYTFAHRDIRRIERSRQEHDYSANPISPAEIEKYKTNRNTWVYRRRRGDRRAGRPGGGLSHLGGQRQSPRCSSAGWARWSAASISAPAAPGAIRKWPWPKCATCTAKAICWKPKRRKKRV